MSEQYFKNLNYSMSNEDSEFEYALLPENSGHVLSICGSGSRVVPLLAKKPKKLTLVDYSSEQLAITQLRIAAIKQLDYNQYLQFLGYQDGMKTNSRYQIFMDLDLPENSRAYLTKFFEQHEWSAPLYLGNYEKALIKMSKIIRFTLGKHIQKLQKIKNQNEFLHYLETDFPLKRWKLLVFILGNSTFLNAILYKGNHPNKNIEQSYSKYYGQLFSKLFSFLIPSQSFFLQMLFYGKILDLKGAPFEANPEIYNKMKEGIKSCDINYFHGEILSIIENKIHTPIDFISFSDILSYFNEEVETIYLQKIKEKLSPKALTVHRYYLHINYGLNIEGYKLITKNFQDLINKEKTQIYTIDVYQRD